MKLRKATLELETGRLQFLLCIPGTMTGMLSAACKVGKLCFFGEKSMYKVLPITVATLGLRSAVCFPRSGPGYRAAAEGLLLDLGVKLCRLQDPDGQENHANPDGFPYLSHDSHGPWPI